MYPRSEVEDAAKRLIECHAEATRRDDWTWFADELYTEDCVYTCEYAGVMFVEAKGREEVKATHYGRDMRRGWEGWTFPYEGFAVTGDQVITHWLNRGPGLRPDGSHYQTHGVTFLTYAGNGRFSRQYDLFDLAHQMKLCDELEDAGLLSPQLKETWVKPMKDLLFKQLGRNR